MEPGHSSSWAATYQTQTKSVPGWFHQEDICLFDLIDRVQNDAGFGGDLLEVGAYLGKSAIALGNMRRRDESLVVVDPWESEVNEPETARDQAIYYSDIRRGAFEQNYLRFHPTLPDVRQGTSDVVLPRLERGTFRFLHIDGAHDWSSVCKDIENALRLVKPGGVIVFDDVFAGHVPGVAAAVWPAIAASVSQPMVATLKLYCVVGSGPTTLGRLEKAVNSEGRLKVLGRYDMFGETVLRIDCVSEPPRSVKGRLPPAAVDLARRSWIGKKARRVLTRFS